MNIKTTAHVSQKNTINTIILAAKDNEQDIDILIITVDNTNINENGSTNHIITTYDKYTKNTRVVNSNDTTLSIANTKREIANINCVSDILIIAYNPEVVKYLNIIDTDINSKLTIDDISIMITGSMPMIKSSFNIIEEKNEKQNKKTICRSVSDMIKINDDQPIAKVTVDVDNIVTIQPIVRILGTPRFGTVNGISASYNINASDDDLNTELQNILSGLDILHSRDTINIVDSSYDVQLSMRNNVSSDRITNLYFNDSRYPNINIYGMLNTKYDDEYMIDLFKQNSKSGQLLYLTTKVLDTFTWIF